MVEVFSHIKYFIDLLKSTEEPVIVHAAMSVGNLARKDENCIEIVKLGALQPLFDLVSHKDTRVQHISLGAIRNLSLSPTNKPLVVETGIFSLCGSPFIDGLNGHVLYGAIGVWKSLVNGGDIYANKFMEAGGLKACLTLCKKEVLEGGERIHYESARIVALLAEKPDHLVALITQEGIFCLLKLIQSSYPLLQFEGAKALLKLCELSEHHTTIIQQGLLEPLIQIATNENAPQIDTNPVVPALLILDRLMENAEARAILQLEDNFNKLKKAAAAAGQKSQTESLLPKIVEGLSITR